MVVDDLFHLDSELNTENMSDEFDLSSLQDQVDSIAAQITMQGAQVRTLKKNSASDADAIGEAVQVLQKLKIDHANLLKQLEEANGGQNEKFNRKVFDELVLRKMFVIPSFEIHGGVKGLFDLGPPACALKVCVMYYVILIIGFRIPSSESERYYWI